MFTKNSQNKRQRVSERLQLLRGFFCINEISISVFVLYVQASTVILSNMLILSIVRETLKYLLFKSIFNFSVGLHSFLYICHSCYLNSSPVGLLIQFCRLDSSVYCIGSLVSVVKRWGCCCQLLSLLEPFSLLLLLHFTVNESGRERAQFACNLLQCTRALERSEDRFRVPWPLHEFDVLFIDETSLNWVRPFLVRAPLVLWMISYSKAV